MAGFVPNTFADVYLGEQQKNMDFSLLRLIKVLGLDPEQGLFFIYDIVCQYIINLLKRIRKDLPENLSIEKAIDLSMFITTKTSASSDMPPHLFPARASLRLKS
jgi:hypothetical protein